MIQEVMLGEWMPDLPDYKNPGVVVANNCYPSPGGYSPFLGPFGSGTAVSGEIRGAIRFERTDGTLVQVIGTTTDLKVVIGGTVTDSSLAYSLAPYVFWSFERFNSQLWAFAYGFTPVYMANVDSDTTFTAHPGVAPKAGSVGRVGDFLVTGNMIDIDTVARPYRIRWSAFNDPAGDYGTDIGKQSGYVDLPRSFGPVVGTFGTRSDVVLQKYGISRLTYTGGATAFRRDTIEDQRGCSATASVVVVGGLVYFLSSDGFCRTDGSSVEVISTSRVFDWFLTNSEAAEIPSVQGAINWSERCVVWSFVPTNGIGRSRQIIYSWGENRWSTASQPNSWLFDATEAGLTLEEVAAIYPDLDTMGPSLDSPEFKAKDRVFAGIINGELVNMTGEALQAEWETGDFQPVTGYRACTDAAYALVENQDASTEFSIGSRGVFKGGAIDWTPWYAVGAAGFAPVIKDGRYLRSRMRIPAGDVWDKAIGMQVEFKVTGRV